MFKIGFYISLITAIVLLFVGFFMEPIGVIDGSILTCVGLLLAFGIASLIPELVSKSKSTKIKAGGAEIEFKGKARKKLLVPDEESDNDSPEGGDPTLLLD